MSAKLKPCPFCGAEPRVRPVRNHSNGMRYASVVCWNDDCKVSVHATGDSEEEAIAAWNRRPE
jgi:Lar family restriction alleviation protein